MKIHEPIEGFIDRYYPAGSVTQYFAENPELYSVAVPGLIGHNGIDIVAPWGTPLFAVEDGEVVEVKDDPTGYGKHVRFITNTGEEFEREWTYGHLSFIMCKVGDIIKAGDTIGLMGNTGFVISDSNGNGYWHYNPYAGTHLHLGCRLFKYDRHGWKYPGMAIGMVTQNCDNGYQGSIDFKDMLPTPPEIPKVQYNFTRAMKYGDRSLDVGKLQEFLKQEGFFKPEVTNYYGNITRQAVFDFQLEYCSLSSYERFILKGGKVGPKTLLAINLKTNG